MTLGPQPYAAGLEERGAGEEWVANTEPQSVDGPNGVCGQRVWDRAPAH